MDCVIPEMTRRFSQEAASVMLLLTSFMPETATKDDDDDDDANKLYFIHSFIQRPNLAIGEFRLSTLGCSLWMLMLSVVINHQSRTLDEYFGQCSRHYRLQ